MFLAPLEEQNKPARRGQVACHQYTPGFVRLEPSYHFLEKWSRKEEVNGVSSVPRQGECIDPPAKKNLLSASLDNQLNVGMSSFHSVETGPMQEPRSAKTFRCLLRCLRTKTMKC